MPTKNTTSDHRGPNGTARTPGAVEEETRANISKIVEIEEAHKSKRTVGERISEAIAAFCGSMTFVWVHVVWFGAWVILNIFPATQFDPFPFTFLTLVVSLEAIFLSTFILISQNHDTKLTERRNHLDLQVNLLTEQENTKMLELLKLIAEKVGVETHDPQTDALAEPIDPERLVDQIMEAQGETAEEAERRKSRPNDAGSLG